MATTTPAVFDGKFIKYPIRFPDGQSTMYSSFVFNGEFEIFEGVSQEWTARLLTEMRSFAAESRNQSNVDRRFSEVPTGQPDSFAMSGTMLSQFDVYKSGRLAIFKATSYEDSPAVTQRRMMKTLRNFRWRQLYEVPNEKGACLPGIFVSSTGADDISNIGVTFRLADHPDVTIFLADRSAGDLSSLTSVQMSELIWTSDAIGRVIHLHGPLRYRPSMMAGRLGTASFATVTRYDGATDYAYLVTVQGDPKAAVDMPDLELLVQRTAKYAAKGVPPVSGEELERIAKAVAASVKRRPIQ
ncbi:T6SS immunity protein Tli4 family protein [Paraburkholderia phenoliruptrix]|uniref:T6SS immunity protein Tli4 family protein n=1 Tax=Paraburkholderia phenoliruptrix TaxID=252970 RepID=UPI001C6E76E5|nr:hypothetical protein [Paraburkholderia phenoliruptrix]MBW9133373.1 hypothetical protein [Paraburkholderia ginsengiterrae]